MLTIPQQAKAVLAYIKSELAASSKDAGLLKDSKFVSRLDMNFITVYGIQAELYGDRSDCLESLVELVKTMGRSWQERPKDLRQLDIERELNPGWFQSHKMLGGVCYVDRYAKNLDGIKAKIPYFQELGLTYLHLMPMVC